MSDTSISYKQRLKILYLYKILLENTDEDHSLKMPEIISKLEEEGISAGRKALYEDISALKDAELLDIASEKGKNAGYRVVNRDFELIELKLLADAVASSRFFTKKKSEELLNKLGKLTSVHEAKQIKREIYVSDREKSENERVYLNVDRIHQSINEKKKISFRYFDYDMQKKKSYRDGIKTCSPYALAWYDERYYLIAYYEKYNAISNFRIDRMENVEVLDEEAQKLPQGFKLTEYLNSTFSMFSGTDEEVRLRFEKSLVNAVIDRFGKNVSLRPDDDNHFVVRVKVKTEHPEPFFGWLFQFGKNAEIIAPTELRDKYKEHLKSVLDSLE